MVLVSVPSAEAFAGFPLTVAEQLWTPGMISADRSLHWEPRSQL